MRGTRVQRCPSQVSRARLVTMTSTGLTSSLSGTFTSAAQSGHQTPGVVAAEFVLMGAPGQRELCPAQQNALFMPGSNDLVCWPWTSQDGKPAGSLASSIPYETDR
ncbi:hypothetical protein ElyMa_006881300 [Elysia marginata]|uniref:Uncharacterized protein n=1 Tax=Elysia marginata TaxID=1093978 RepID=A0AAV4JD78_9GAST|nr:hypothetical protein ElyMa_006881300 [Elysia marginata]